MKKLCEMFKPFLSIIFGSILFLLYLNYLQSNSGMQILGVIGFLLSLYYLAIGIIEVFFDKKIPISFKRVLNLLSVVLFPFLMFVHYIFVIRGNSNYFGPTAWVIAIFSLVGSVAMITIYIISFFVQNKTLRKLEYLFFGIFALILLLSLAFDVSGAPIRLGNLDIVSIVLYLFYLGILLAYIINKEKGLMEDIGLIEESVEDKDEIDIDTTEE